MLACFYFQPQEFESEMNFSEINLQEFISSDSIIAKSGAYSVPVFLHQLTWLTCKSHFLTAEMQKLLAENAWIYWPDLPEAEKTDSENFLHEFV